MSKAFQGQSYSSFKIYILIKLRINVQYKCCYASLNICKIHLADANDF